MKQYWYTVKHLTVKGKKKKENEIFAESLHHTILSQITRWRGLKTRAKSLTHDHIPWLAPRIQNDLEISFNISQTWTKTWHDFSENWHRPI